jgi:hypothetical protein
VLGHRSHGSDPSRGAGPVIRVCLRAAICPVVVIGAPESPSQHHADHVPAAWQRDLEGAAAVK